MGKVIALANQKGGVGKTTTAVNLGASLAALEKKTLIIDLDPQGNTTSGLGVDKGSSSGRNIYNGLLEMTPLIELYRSTELERLKVVPSDRNLVGLEVELMNEGDRQRRLGKLVRPVRDHFDYIFVDCPPSLGLLTLNALACSDSILIPIQCEYFALEGVSELLTTIKRVRKSLNHGLMVEGILLTMYDERTNLSKQVADEIRKYFGNLVYDSIIPRNVRLGEAPSFGKPIITYDIRSKGAEAYLKLAKEVIRHGKKGTGQRA